jgi:hypothetical protein
MVDILMRTTILAFGNRTAQVQRNLDLCLQPPINDFGMLDFEKMEEFVDVIYRYMLKAAADLRPPQP